MRALIVLAYLSLLTLGLMDNVRGPFYPEILNDLKLNNTEGSAFFAIASLMAFVGSWFCHRLMRGRDVLTVMAGVSLVFTLGYVLMARAPQYAWLLSGCAIFGWAYGSLNVLQNVIVCEAAPVHLRRRLLNGLQSMYGLAALLAPLFATSLRNAGLDWRMVFLILSALPLLIVGLALWHRGEVQAHPPQRQAFTGAEKWRCAAFALMLSLYLWGELSISTRLVLWLRVDQGFSPEAADTQLAIFFLTLLGGRLALALVDLKQISNWMILSVCVFSSALLYFVGLSFSPYGLAVCGLTLSPFFPMILDQAAQTFGVKGTHAVGVIIGMGNLSIMSMHLMVGVLGDLYGLTAALYCGPVALLLVGGALIWVQWQERRALTL